MTPPFKIHFKSELLDTVQQEATSELHLSEIIFKNQILVSITPPDSTAAGSGTDKQVELIPGEYTELSEDGDALRATITGYPFIERRQSGRVLSVQVDMKPLVQVEADGMQASLTLYPVPSGSEPWQREKLEAILQEEGICYGIDQAMLVESLTKLAEFRQPLHNIPIARGVLPIDGRNAYLRFEVEIDPIPGKVLRDGTIDFRERNIFIGVDENQVIAVRVPQTVGTAGINVFGQSTAQRPGKDISVKVSGDVSYSPETGQVTTTRSGVLSVVKGTEIKVSAKQTIPGDVDFTVGNIESRDCLEIKGSVHPGFTVKTRGDLRIGGNVEGATVVCKGNVVIGGGLLGEASSLEAQGDADINFTERARVTVGGKIIIRKEAYYSRVIGDGDLFCSPGSRIIGCIFCCAGNFAGSDVGSSRGGPVTIAAGVDGRRYDKLESLKQQLRAIEEEMETLAGREGTKRFAEDGGEQEESELQSLRAALRQLNLIPKTPVYSRLDPILSHSDAWITIQGTAAAGTKLRIGNLVKILEESCSAVKFHVDAALGQIVATKL